MSIETRELSEGDTIGERLRVFADGGPFTWRHGLDTDFNWLRKDIATVLGLVRRIAIYTNCGEIEGLTPGAVKDLEACEIATPGTDTAGLSGGDAEQVAFEQRERADWGDLHRLQQRGPNLVKPRLGGHIVRWAADEIAALRSSR